MCFNENEKKEKGICKMSFFLIVAERSPFNASVF